MTGRVHVDNDDLQTALTENLNGVAKFAPIAPRVLKVFCLKTSFTAPVPGGIATAVCASKDSGMLTAKSAPGAAGMSTARWWTPLTGGIVTCWIHCNIFFLSSKNFLFVNALFYPTKNISCPSKTIPLWYKSPTRSTTSFSNT